MKPYYLKEVGDWFVKYSVGCSDGGVGFEGGLMVTLNQLEQGKQVRAEVARTLLELRRDLRERLQNSRRIGQTSNSI